MSKRKPMSFGLVVGLALGGFVVFVLVGVLILKAAYAPSGPQQVTRTPITRQPEAPQQKVDAVGDHLQMETMIAAKTAEANASAQRQVVEKMVASYEDQILPQLQEMQTETAMLRETIVLLDQRMQVLEGGSGVKVIKPERAPRRNSTDRARSSRPTGAIDANATGYTVQAVVGPRAWVTAANGQDASVVAGDRLPPVVVPRPTTTTDNRLESSSSH